LRPLDARPETELVENHDDDLQVVRGGPLAGPMRTEGELEYIPKFEPKTCNFTLPVVGTLENDEEIADKLCARYSQVELEKEEAEIREAPDTMTLLITGSCPGGETLQITDTYELQTVDTQLERETKLPYANESC
jgi:hypothetical protein